MSWLFLCMHDCSVRLFLLSQSKGNNACVVIFHRARTELDNSYPLAAIAGCLTITMSVMSFFYYCIYFQNGKMKETKLQAF